MGGEIEIIARGVAVSRGRILICRNRKKGNVYLPGGHIEFNESARRALERELKEETGLSCRAGRFFGASEHTFVHKKKRTCEINLFFELKLAGADSRKPAPALEEQLEFIWLPISALNKSKLQPYTLREKLPLWIGNTGRAAGAWSSSYEE